MATKAKPDGARSRSRGRRWVYAAVIGVALAAAVVAGVLSVGDNDRITAGGNALAHDLGLPAKHACGKETQNFRPPGEDGKTRVFALKATWHWVRKCLDDLLAVAAKAPPDAPIHAFIETQVLYVLAQRPVRFYAHGDDKRHRLKELVGDAGSLDLSQVDRLVYTNRNGVAHNAMSQAALGTWFLEAKRVAVERGLDAAAGARYEALGLAALSVILDPVAEGGLSSTHGCELAASLTCTWFHAVTSRTRGSPAEGGTLNKHLIVINALERASLAIAAIDRADGAPRRGMLVERYADAADAGLHQLVYAAGHADAGAPPNLADYIPKDEAGAPILRSWLYYGLNPARAGQGYFLKVNKFKNCHYHLTDMRLLRDALASAGSDADLSGFRTPRAELDDRSIVGFIIATFQTKRAEGLFADAPTVAPGNWAGCREDMFSDETARKIVAGLEALAPAP